MNQFADSKSLEAPIPMPREGDYEADFVLWVEHQAALLRENRLDELDREHLIEELEAMSGKDRRELRSRLAVILIHLLKCRFQPERKTSSWIATLGEQRDQVAHLLEQSPSLKASLDQYISDAYSSALKRTALETGLPHSNFPLENPFSPEQLLDLDFIP